MRLEAQERARLVGRYGEDVIRRYEEAPPITPGFHKPANITDEDRRIEPTAGTEEGNCALELFHYLLTGKPFTGGPGEILPRYHSGVASFALMVLTEFRRWPTAEERDAVIRPWVLRLLETFKTPVAEKRRMLALANKINELADWGQEPFSTEEEVLDYLRARCPEKDWGLGCTPWLVFASDPSAEQLPVWAEAMLEAVFNA